MRPARPCENPATNGVTSLMFWSGVSGAVKKRITANRKYVTLHPGTNFGQMLDLVGFMDACPKFVEQQLPVWRGATKALVAQNNYDAVNIYIGGAYYNTLRETTLYQVELPALGAARFHRDDLFATCTAIDGSRLCNYHTLWSP